MDRDGVINEDKGYVYKPIDFNLYSDAIKLIKFSASLKIPIFIVTNQSGIGRGFYSFRDFKNLNQHFLKNFNEFEKSMISISYCPHRPNIGCACRKPKSYMLRRIIRKNRIKVANSYIVGDKISDVFASWRERINYIFYINRNNNFSSLDKLSPTLKNKVKGIDSLNFIIDHMRKEV